VDAQFRDDEMMAPPEGFEAVERSVPLCTINTKVHSYEAYGRYSEELNEYGAALKRGEKPSLKRDTVTFIRKWGALPRERALRAAKEEELEDILNFPITHTEVGMAPADRRKALGNVFDPDVIAYLLEPLQDMQCRGQFGDRGLVVLSLFDGIGGAAVALAKKLHIRIDKYFSVEIEAKCHQVVKAFFEKPELRKVLGRDKLFQYGDITSKDEFYATKESLQAWLRKHAIQPERLLVIGGSPCNNMEGTNNRQGKANPHGQCGLKGTYSQLYYKFTKIIQWLRELTDD